MDILFWSGGKDSYLSYHFYGSHYPNRSFALLTTFNKATSIVPHQQIPINRIKEQAEQLGAAIHPVALPPECPNDVYLKKVCESLNQIQKNSKRLIFGDRLAPEIQNWRKDKFNARGYECYFPIEKKSTGELLHVLHQQPVETRISAVSDEYKDDIEVGEPFNSAFVKQLPEGIDPMGEQGEFHTEVILQQAPD